MYTEPELLNERLERLAMVLDEIMPNCSLLVRDALELLKKQEAVVHPEPSCEMTYITDCCCDLCGVQLIREDNYCRCCGKRIEWEGR